MESENSKKMEELLDQLIDNARQLLEASQSVIAEDDLNALQKKQAELIAELEVTSDKDDSPLTNGAQKKLQTFAKLNQQFIDNINSHKGIIRFEQ